MAKLNGGVVRHTHRRNKMSAYKELTIPVHAGILAWLESEAKIINADLQALGQPGNVTSADVAMVLLERGIATAVARQAKQTATPQRERAVGQRAA
jgi:hypothetical protein